MVIVLVIYIKYKLYSIYSQSFSEKMKSLHENSSWRSLKIKMHLLSLDRRCIIKNMKYTYQWFTL